MNNQKFIVSLVLCATLFGGGGYYLGTKKTLPTNETGAPRVGRSAFGTGAGPRASRQGGGFASGEIVNIDAQSLTLKLQDGGSKIIFYTGDTPISKMASGNTSDLLAGESIMVTGKTNPDGSVTAESIQLRPEGSVRTITYTPVTQQ